MIARDRRTVLVAGGAGYVGAILVPKLLVAGYCVKVLDLYIYGRDALASIRSHPHLTEIQGDVRDQALIQETLRGCDHVIHLACISNDPSVELDPQLSRSINLDSFEPFVKRSRDAGIQRFIFASSSSVYGVSDALNITEDHPNVPITDYNRYKAQCEEILRRYHSDTFHTTIIRPATLCGYSPRMRLDLTVNILTNHAIHHKKITVFGGAQKRPHLHIQDMTDLYRQLLREPLEKISGQTFNVAKDNYTVADVARIVQATIQEKMQCAIDIVMTASDDIRSYHIASDKIRQCLGFTPQRTVRSAVEELYRKMSEGAIPNPLEDSCYFNIKRMQHMALV